MIQIDSSSLIIYRNSVYGFTIKERYCPEALSYRPCDFCALKESCVQEDPQLCTLFDAIPDEFYVECGVVEVDKTFSHARLIPLNGFQFI